MLVVCTLWELLQTTVWMLVGFSSWLLKEHFFHNYCLLLSRINAHRESHESTIHLKCVEAKMHIQGSHFYVFRLTHSIL